MSSYQHVRGHGLVMLTLDNGQTMQFSISRAEVQLDTATDEINEMSAAGNVIVAYSYDTTRMSLDAIVDKAVMFDGKS